MRTQVGIIGAGPAGLLLSHLLHLHGIVSVIIEARSRHYCEERIRAGVLEQGSVELLCEAAVGARLKREGLVHSGLELSFAGHRHRIDLSALTDGKAITVYPQHEVVKDLIAARLGSGGQIMFEAAATRVDGLDTDRPVIHFMKDGKPRELACDFIAGCDGFHGICRPSVPAGALTFYDQVYPFAWLGIMAQAKPSSDELVYTHHARGFSLLTLRTPEISRLYLQCAPNEDLGNWSDDRIWSELRARNATDDGLTINEGPITQKGITPMRSFVTEPMQYGKLFLAGDAAHIVPPTGAKGMNLAIADVHILTRAFEAFYQSGGKDRLTAYSATCLKRVWRVQHFSWWMTSMLHRFADATSLRGVGGGAFRHKIQLSELAYVTNSPAAATTLAENYVGLPFE